MAQSRCGRGWRTASQPPVPAAVQSTSPPRSPHALPQPTLAARSALPVRKASKAVRRLPERACVACRGRARKARWEAAKEALARSHQLLHADGLGLSAGEGVLHAVAHDDHHREALAGLVGSGADLGRVDAAKLAGHPVVRRIEALEVLLGAADLQSQPVAQGRGRSVDVAGGGRRKGGAKAGAGLGVTGEGSQSPSAAPRADFSAPTGPTTARSPRRARQARCERLTMAATRGDRPGEGQDQWPAVKLQTLLPTSFSASRQAGGSARRAGSARNGDQAPRKLAHRAHRAPPCGVRAARTATEAAARLRLQRLADCALPGLLALVLVAAVARSGRARSAPAQASPNKRRQDGLEGSCVRR